MWIFPDYYAEVFRVFKFSIVGRINPAPLEIVEVLLLLQTAKEG